MYKNLKNTYKGKKILITGHTGFKGSWLSTWLIELGADVIGYSLDPPTQPNLFDSLSLDKKLIHIIGDVRDEEHIFSIFKKYQPEFVFHLAAQPLVRFSYEEPKLTYETNVMGTVNILEAVRKIKSVRVCIIVSTDKCYENKEWVYGYREIDPVGGYDPYSSSKGCAELVTAAYGNSFFNTVDYGKRHNIALSTARAGNVIGGGDWGKDRLIPDCIRMLSHNKTIIIRNPKAIRPWQYVLEPLSGYLLLGSLMYKNGKKYSSAWNFGPNDNDFITVEELLKLVIKNWGSGDYKIETPYQPHEASLLKLDVSKAHTLLKWRSTYNISKTIKNTINWYKIFYNDKKVKDLFKLTVKEIESFVNF